MTKDYDSHWPLQYQWVLGGSATPSVKYKVTIEPNYGRHTFEYAQMGKRKTVVIEPNDGYLPPDTIQITPPTGLAHYLYDEYTGAVVLVNVVSDIKITGTCRKMVHTHSAIKAQPYQHGDLNKYFLTHEKIKG